MSSELSDSWRDYKDHLKKVKAKHRNQEVLSLTNAIYETGIDIEKKSDYQFRLTKDEKRVDFFPTSNKYHDLNKNERGYCNVDKLISMFNS